MFCWINCVLLDSTLPYMPIVTVIGLCVLCHSYAAYAAEQPPARKRALNIPEITQS